MWVLFRKTTSQPFADQPPLTPLWSLNREEVRKTMVGFCVRFWVGYSQDGVIPEDTDGFRALLSGDKAELHGDGFVQIVLQQSVVIVYGDADHWRVDDRTLRHAGDDESTQKLNICISCTERFLFQHRCSAYRRLLLSES